MEQQDLFAWAEQNTQKDAKVIDLTYELRVRELATEMYLDLGMELPKSKVGSLDFAYAVLDMVEGFDASETIEGDHPELFQLLRARVGS